uniref:Reverse transcriptase domain-containing protein n=1 Tax=Timema poppense TaxID=170557 RepID=A0A7R9DD31_TIMPO|nr:unnamed protein product [Timema poppensis]
MLEPVLYLLKGIPETQDVVAFEDDLLIVIEGYSRRNLEGKSNQVLEELYTWCKSVKLKMALGKTTYMLFKGRLTRDPTIKVDNKDIPSEDPSLHCELWGVHLGSQTNQCRSGYGDSKSTEEHITGTDGSLPDRSNGFTECGPRCMAVGPPYKKERCVVLYKKGKHGEYEYSHHTRCDNIWRDGNSPIGKWQRRWER